MRYGLRTQQNSVSTVTKFAIVATLLRQSVDNSSSGHPCYNFDLHLTDSHSQART